MNILTPKKDRSWKKKFVFKDKSLHLSSNNRLNIISINLPLIENKQEKVLNNNNDKIILKTLI